MNKHTNVVTDINTNSTLLLSSASIPIYGGLVPCKIKGNKNQQRYFLLHCLHCLHSQTRSNILIYKKKNLKYYCTSITLSMVVFIIHQRTERSILLEAACRGVGQCRQRPTMSG